MTTIATVVIRNKRNGKTRRINEYEWAHDLGKGKYDGWERVGGERHGDADESVTIDDAAAKAQADADAAQVAEIKAAEEAAAMEAEEKAAAVKLEEADAKKQGDEDQAEDARAAKELEDESTEETEGLL